MCQKYFHDTNSLSLNVKINVRMFNKYQNLIQLPKSQHFHIEYTFSWFVISCNGI